MLAHIARLVSLKNIFLVFWGAYFFLLWNNQLFMRDGMMMAGSDRTWADGAAHLSYISAFAERSFFLTEHPLYKGAHFSYPPASDWLAALLVRLGARLTFSFSFVGLVLSLLTIHLLYIFYYQLTHQNSLASVFSALLFLWCGGFGFVLPLFENVSSPGMLLRLTELPAYGVRFINTVDAELLPQRAFLLGLPVGLFVLTTLWKLFDHQKTRQATLAFSGFLAGLLPLIHPHTFIVISAVFGWLSVYYTLFERKKWPVFIFAFGPFFSFGLLLTLWQTQDLRESFFWLKWGWLAGDFDLPWLWFWFVNWGIWVVLALVGFIRSKITVRLFALPFLGLFLLANILVFQPYDWDNSKLFTWVHLVFSGLAGNWLFYVWTQPSRLKKTLVIFLFLVATLSGLHDSMQLIHFSRTTLPIFNAHEVAAADWIKANTDSEAVFLTSDTHRHFVPALAGRQIIMGYRGWLWSYGIDYTHREKDVLAMFAGNENSLALMQAYEIDYVIVSPSEKDAYYRANERFMSGQLVRVYTNPEISIFALNDHGLHI